MFVLASHLFGAFTAGFMIHGLYENIIALEGFQIIRVTTSPRDQIEMKIEIVSVTSVYRITSSLHISVH